MSGSGEFIFVLYHAAFLSAHLNKHFSQGLFKLNFVGRSGVLGIEKVDVWGYEGCGELVREEIGGITVDVAQLFDGLLVRGRLDAVMLRHGPYPEYLKARIATDHGHMDNADTAALLKAIHTPALQYVFLCHLSHDNNTPEKALTVVRTALEEKGLKVGDCTMSFDDRAADLHLMALPRHDATRLFVFRK